MHPVHTPIPDTRGLNNPKPARALSLAVALALAAGAAAQVSIDHTSFIDRAAAGQITLGNLRGGLAVLDYDRDGWPDLFVCDTAGATNRLFHNVSGAATARTFVDVTQGSGLNDADGVQRNGGAAIAGDIDNDGDLDLFVLGYTTADSSHGVLYRNDGNGTFTNISLVAGIRHVGAQPMSASFVDYDLDGKLDLFIGGIGATSDALLLYRGNGDGTFTPMSSLLPPPLGSTTLYSHVWCDIDRDGDPDCILLSAGGQSAKILRNDFDSNTPAMVPLGVELGYAALGPAPMGIAAGDYDNDGDFDLAITNAQIGTYFRNDAGIFSKITPISTIFGWGVLWIDADNDGWLDNYQCGSLGQGANLDRLWRNLGDGTFKDISGAMNSTFSVSQHAVQVDWNNDGRADIVSVNPVSPGQYVAVYENVSDTPGHWIELDVRGDGRIVNRDAIGAIVRLTASGMTQSRQIVSGSSTTSTEDLRVHFGLSGTTSVDRVEIEWPASKGLSAHIRTYEGPFAADQLMPIVFECPADVNHDGFVNGDDYDAFAEAFDAATAWADFNGDGFVNGDDYDAFAASFDEGC
jgi:hypothetical protein